MVFIFAEFLTYFRWIENSVMQTHQVYRNVNWIYRVNFALTLKLIDHRDMEFNRKEIRDSFNRRNIYHTTKPTHFYTEYSRNAIGLHKFCASILNLIYSEFVVAIVDFIQTANIYWYLMSYSNLVIQKKRRLLCI